MVTLGLVLVGIALRVVQFCIERALWFDEARNSVEILKPDWLRMLPPYALQPTSSGFLVVERFFVSALGDSEWALRLFPLLAGVGALNGVPELATGCIGGIIALGMKVLERE